jgi:hypothetical protein
MTDHFGDVASGLVGPIVSAFAGMVMRRAYDHEAGKPFSCRKLLVHLPTVAGLAIVGGGLGTWLGAHEEVRWAIAALFGYGGQQTLELVFRCARAAATRTDLAAKTKL